MKLRNLLFSLLLMVGCADQGWANPDHDKHAPGAPDEPNCEKFHCEADVVLDNSSDKHGAQGENTLHQATGVRSWWEYDWVCNGQTDCPGATWQQGFPPREYGSAFYVYNNTNRWWQIRQIWVSFRWNGLGTWALLPDDTAGLCDAPGSWCIQFSNLNRGGTSSRAGWVDVTDKNIWVPPYSWSPAWQVWIRVRPGVLDTGSLPKLGVNMDAVSVKYTDGP